MRAKVEICLFSTPAVPSQIHQAIRNSSRSKGLSSHVASARLDRLPHKRTTNSPVFRINAKISKVRLLIASRVWPPKYPHFYGKVKLVETPYCYQFFWETLAVGSLRPRHGYKEQYRSERQNDRCNSYYHPLT